MSKKNHATVTMMHYLWMNIDKGASELAVQTGLPVETIRKMIDPLSALAPSMKNRDAFTIMQYIGENLDKEEAELARQTGLTVQEVINGISSLSALDPGIKGHNIDS